VATKSSKSLPGCGRAEFGCLRLGGLDFFFLEWRGGTGLGWLLDDGKTLRHVSVIHKAEKRSPRRAQRAQNTRRKSGIIQIV